MSQPTLHPLPPHLRSAWAAVRARMSLEHPWVIEALFRATPVLLRDTAPLAPAVTADAWGRVYLPEATLEGIDARGVQALTPLVREALLHWLSAQTPRLSWHAGRTDERFPAASRAETSRAAHTAAAGLHATPPRHGDPLGSWRDWAAALAGPPRVPWQDALGGHLRAAVTTQAGHLHRTFTRPGRRTQPGVVTPAWRAPQVDIAVIVDISGSVEPNLPTILRELAGIASAAGMTAERTPVYAVDDAVASVSTLTATTRLASREGHLTDLRPGFTAVTHQARPAQIVIVVTDGLTPWPQQEPAASVIVALTGTGTVRDDARPDVPAWADIVEIDTEEPL